MPARSAYRSSVFINCPFDDEYTPIFEALVFAVMACLFQPTSARQRLNAAEIRLDKISSLIHSARLSIHDLSRTALDSATGTDLPALLSAAEIESGEMTFIDLGRAIEQWLVVDPATKSI